LPHSRRVHLLLRAHACPRYRPTDHRESDAARGRGQWLSGSDLRFSAVRFPATTEL